MSQENFTVEERYAQLKSEFDEIDKKYNRTLNDIELDFPPSLGLSKLTFTPTDQEKLTELAQGYYDGYYDQKLAEFTQSNLQKQGVQESKLLQQSSKHDKECQSLKQKYDKKRLDFIDKAIKNCIMASSIYQSELKRLLDEYNAEVQKAQQEHQDAVDGLNQTLQLLQNLLSQASQSIQQQKQSKIDEKLFGLNKDEQKQSDSVTKYNNTVDKQEADYKVKIEKAYATVTASEQRRALEAINLLATVGVAGVEKLKSEEKVTIAKEFFVTLGRQQAKELFDNDSTLEYHFSSYYSYMQEYVNNLPI